MLKALGLAAILAVPSLAMAQKEAKKEYQAKPQHIDITEGDEVLGAFTGPDGPVVGSVKRGPHESLIKIRWTFVPELIKSADDR
ncbi:MAG TPA: hypothetical protein VFF06_31960 [Polyangia bacterium]|nr:hypothetical protein [Polyangia bacterium]